MEEKAAPPPPDSRPLTQDELALARELIDSYRAARSVGRAMRMMLIGLALIAAAITAWESIAGKARAWFGGH